MNEGTRSVDETSRRQFLARGGVLAGGLLVAGAAPAVAREPERPERVADEHGTVRPAAQAEQTQTGVVRYDVATFTEGSPQLAALRRGVAAMKARPSTDPTSWDYQANVHKIFCDSPPPGYSPVHYSWRFLAWHRAYLWYFEKILQRAAGSPSLSLPYWNWTTALQLPAQYWGTGNPLFDPRRVMTPTSRLDPTQTAIDRLLALPTFSQFGGDQSSAGALEGGPHNYVHRTVGGDMGRFSTAALDPVFWAHHSNVDRVWWMWNQQGKANPADPAWLNIQYPFYDVSVGRSVNVTFAQAAAFPVKYAPAMEVIAVTGQGTNAPPASPRSASVVIPAGTAARLTGAGPAGATLRVTGLTVPSEAVTVRVHANQAGANATDDRTFAGSFTLIPTDGDHSAHGPVNVHVALGGGFRRALTAATEALTEAPVGFTLVPEGPGASQLRYENLELHVGH